MRAIDKNTVLMVSLEMLDFDLSSSTRHSARIVSIRLRHSITFDFFQFKHWIC